LLLAGQREAISGNSVAIGENRSKLRLAERFYLALKAICAIYSNSTGMYAGQECLGNGIALMCDT